MNPLGFPAYETFRRVSPWAGVVLASNASPMTLDGTNTWLLAAPQAPAAIVVDPGPGDPAHLRAVVDAAGQVAAILLTHGHADHSEGARALHELTGAPVRCLDPRFRVGAEGLHEGDVVAAAGVELRVWATPGHSSDSLSFLLEPGEGDAAVLTGDTILGQGSTVVAHPDGDLAHYLDSLHRLVGLGDAAVLPGHGPELPAAAEAAAGYLAHRQQRLEQVRAALAGAESETVTPWQIVEIVYADVPQVLWPAAELSVAAQLKYLREHG